MWYLQFFSYFISSLFCIGCFWFSWETLRDSQRARKWTEQNIREAKYAANLPQEIIIGRSVSDRLRLREKAEMESYERLIAEIDEITA